jgi:hypothetical protein
MDAEMVQFLPYIQAAEFIGSIYSKISGLKTGSGQDLTKIALHISGTVSQPKKKREGIFRGISMTRSRGMNT